MTKKHFNTRPAVPASRHSKTHALKCWPEYFQAIQDGEKTFEIRQNDRDFQKGDVLHLKEYVLNDCNYTGNELHAKVVYIFHGHLDMKFGLLPGYVVMGIKVVDIFEGLDADNTKNG